MKQFDFGRYPKRRIALLFLYLGWDFDGLVTQSNTQNTVEEFFFGALLKTKLVESRESCEWTRCGRTDRGVSAFRQVAAVTVRSTDVSSIGHFWTAERKDKITSTVELPYVKMLNAVLPESIRVLAFAPVRRDFSARFNCIQREYTYIFPRASIADFSRLSDACGRLCGTHDFRNFCHIDRNEKRLESSYVRTVTEVRVDQLNNSSFTDSSLPSTSAEPFDPFQLMRLTVKASGFLWHQIRCIVAVLWEIANGNEEPGLIDEMFDVLQFSARPQYKMANGLPLCFFDCSFDEPIDWKFDLVALGLVINTLQKKWAEHQIRAANIKSMLNGLAFVPNGPYMTNGLDEFVRTEPAPKNYLSLRKRPRCEGLEERRRKAQQKKLKIEGTGEIGRTDKGQ